MNKRSIGFSLIIVGLCMSSIVLAGEKVHWGYSGHAIGGVDLLNRSQFMLLNSWGNWGRGTEYSTIDHGFGVAERRSIMWGYGAYAFRTPIVEPIDWLTTGHEAALDAALAA